MAEADAAARITALHEAFRALSASIPNLVVKAPGAGTGAAPPIPPDRGFFIGLHRPDGAAAELHVRADAGELLVSPSEPERAVGAQPAWELIDLGLSDGYRWGTSVFENADQMARMLLAYLVELAEGA